MRRSFMYAGLMVMAMVAVTVAADTAAPAAVVELSKGELAKLAVSPVVVSAVKAQNAKGATLDSIKDLDTKWMATAGIDPFMKSLMDSACGKYLQDTMKSHDYIVEAFVTDNQGANVCMAAKTSDYWQGDEPKFSEPWASKQALVAPVKFDKSSQSYTSQVSVLVMDGGTPVGVAVFGVDVAKFK